MKKTILPALAFALIVSFAFTSCSSKKEERENQNMHEEVTDESGDGIKVEENEAVDTNSTAHTHYYCPMKCEGEKMYDEDVPCPVCGMELKTSEHEGH